MSAPAGPKIVAFGGGKGGIGKSLAAANVAMNLAAMGKDVVLVDAAFGGPTLHAFTGVAKLARSLGDYVRAPSVEVLAVNKSPIGERVKTRSDDDTPFTSPGATER